MHASTVPVRPRDAADLDHLAGASARERVSDRRRRSVRVSRHPEVLPLDRRRRPLGRPARVQVQAEVARLGAPGRERRGTHGRAVGEGDSQANTR